MGRECVCGLDETCPKPGFMLCQTRRVSNLLARVSVEKKRTESLAAELAQVKTERDEAAGLVRPRAKMPVGLMDVPEQLEWQRNALAFLARVASGETASKDGE